jgi:hypothetical protein
MSTAQNHEPVAKIDQIHEMDEKPAQPGHEIAQGRAGILCRYGFSTTLIQSSSLFKKMSYPLGASSSRMRWVMIKLGSISPF